MIKLFSSISFGFSSPNKSIIVGAIFALLGLVGVFSNSDSGDDMRSGLAIKTEKGTVYITKDTFESIILGVARNYAELRNVKVEISINETGVIANIYTFVLSFVDICLLVLYPRLSYNILIPLSIKFSSYVNSFFILTGFILFKIKYWQIC